MRIEGGDGREGTGEERREEEGKERKGEGTGEERKGEGIGEEREARKGERRGEERRGEERSGGGGERTETLPSTAGGRQVAGIWEGWGGVTCPYTSSHKNRQIKAEENFTLCHRNDML